MKRIVLICGLIAGLIAAAWCVCSIAYCYYTKTFGGSMVLGYASMLLAFSLVFVGIKNYRDQYNGGTITFGKAFRVGILIVLVASTVYVLAWVIDYYVFLPDFTDRYIEAQMRHLNESHASAAEIADKMKENEMVKSVYGNPFGVILFTYFEIFPVGLVVTIIAALILKRKTPAAAVNVA